MGDWLPLIVIIVWLPIFGRFIAWLTDPDRPHRFHLGGKLGRLVFGKRWDCPLGKGFEERAVSRNDGGAPHGTG